MRGYLQLIFLLLGLKNFDCEEYCNLPKECKILHLYREKEKITTGFECNLSENQNNSAFKIEKCPEVKENKDTEIFLDANSKLIIDNTSLASVMGYFNSQNFIQKHLKINKIRGLNIESSIQVKIQYRFLMIFYLMPDLVDQKGHAVKDCGDFERLNNPSFFLKTNDTGFVFEIDIFESKVQICDLFFKDAHMTYLSFRYLVNTYFKKRQIEFTTQKGLNTSINSDITIFDFASCYDIDLNEKMFNERIVEKTYIFVIFCPVNSIKDDYFTHFKSLNVIQFFSSVFIRLIRRQGIEWIKQMNHDVNVDFANKTQVIFYWPLLKVIRFFPESIASKDTNYQYLYDEDFCLLKDFPIHQMVFLLIDKTNYYLNSDVKIADSCILLWLYRYGKYLTIENELYHINFSNFQQCNFKKRIENCNISGEIVRKERERTFNEYDFMILSEFLEIMASPLICVFGIVTNTIVILVIIKKENRKDLKQKQYTYMAIHSVSNIFICFIEILSLVNQCQLPFGIYCSSIRYNVVIQYFKIIFGEYFSCFFRLFSNFTYVAFALNRLSLIGNNPNKVTKFFSDLGIKKYIAFSIILSAALPVVKLLRYQINTIAYERYMPVLFFNFTHFLEHETIYKLLIIFNSVHDIVNYILFVLLNLIIDILLIKKLREAMKEREEKVKDQIEVAKEKVKKENEESFRRVIYMVILSSLLNFLLKLPIVITSLNDLRLLITTYDLRMFDQFDDFSFPFPYSMEYFCNMDKVCMIFLEFGNFLFLISLSVNFFFLKRFDKNFCSAYELFKPKK